MPRTHRLRVGSPRLGSPLTRPNVLLVMTDDQEPDCITPEVMPYLASQPHGSWVAFPNAIQTTPLCGISRATLLTGQRHQRHRVTSHSATNLAKLDETDTIATTLAGAGYRTGLLGKYQNAWPSYTATPAGYVPAGWEAFHGRTDETEPYYNWNAYTNIPGAPTSGGTADADYYTDVLAGLADDFIRGNDGRPWLCVVTPGAPHDPPTPAPRHAGLTFTVPDQPDWNAADLTGFPAWLRNLPVLTTAEQDRTRANRRNARRVLRSVDDLMQTLVTALTDTGQLDNTVVIYYTDNAVMMGRKRMSTEGNSIEKRVPYQGSIGAEMRVRYPGAVQRTEPAPVPTVDIPVSVVAWGEGTWGHVVDGSTRLADWCLDLGGRRPAAEGTYPLGQPVPAWNALLTDDRVKYVEYPDTGEREVFDLNTDPWEQSNLHGQDPARDTALASRLAQHMADPLFWEV